MTQTMSGPNDSWLQFYNQNLTPSIPDFTVTTNATVTTTTIVAATSPSQDMSNSSSSGPTRLSQEGRVVKPTRRRSRASRRTPTTLLNTDTTNFRAMVQQFTGGPSAPYASNPSLAPQVLPNLMGFGFPSRPVPSPTTLVMTSSPPITYLQQQQQQHMFQQQNQQYNFCSTAGGGGTQGGGDDDDDNNNNSMFFQRLCNNNVNPIISPSTSNVVVSNNNNRGGDGGAVNTDHGRFFPSSS